MILSQMIAMAMAAGTFFVFGPRRLFLLGFLGNPRFESIAGRGALSRKNCRRLFLHVQIIFYGFDPFDAAGDFPRFIDGLLRIHETTQLHDALVGFDTDLE
jgi:hypothetical protein